jgi:hypothetical protein
MMFGTPLDAGYWMPMRKGEPVKMEVLIGEGLEAIFLMIQEKDSRDPVF